MRQVALIFLVMTLASCSSIAPRGPEQIFVPKLEYSVDLADTSKVKKKLLDQYSEWKGTSYQMGGLSKQGIDCSGFVYATFRAKLGLDMPRSTKMQSKVGVKVSKDQLRIGDLIFFKTGLLDRHVGVYLGDSKFLHASTSKGVTISSLVNSYWSSNYWLSRRVLH